MVRNEGLFLVVHRSDLLATGWQLTADFMTWVKICGITNLEDALVAVEAGADAVGFVFYEKSPRKMSVEAAREIVEKLPERMEKIGVFVNELPERVSTVADEAGLTAVQFHGDEYREHHRSTLLIGRLSFACRRWRSCASGAKGGAFVTFSGFPNLCRGPVGFRVTRRALVVQERHSRGERRIHLFPRLGNCIPWLLRAGSPRKMWDGLLGF